MHQLVLTQVCHIPPFEPYTAGRWIIDPYNRLAHGSLARPGLANERAGLATYHAECNSINGLDLTYSFSKDPAIEREVLLERTHAKDFATQLVLPRAECAFDKMTRCHFHHFRSSLIANGHPTFASGMKPASARRIHIIGHHPRNTFSNASP